MPRKAPGNSVVVVVDEMAVDEISFFDATSNCKDEKNRREDRGKKPFVKRSPSSCASLRDRSIRSRPSLAAMHSDWLSIARSPRRTPRASPRLRASAEDDEKEDRRVVLPRGKPEERVAYRVVFLEEAQRLQFAVVDRRRWRLFSFGQEDECRLKDANSQLLVTSSLILG